MLQKRTVEYVGCIPLTITNVWLSFCVNCRILHCSQKLISQERYTRIPVTFAQVLKLRFKLPHSQRERTRHKICLSFLPVFVPIAFPAHGNASFCIPCLLLSNLKQNSNLQTNVTTSNGQEFLYHFAVRVDAFPYANCCRLFLSFTFFPLPFLPTLSFLFVLLIFLISSSHCLCIFHCCPPVSLYCTRSHYRTRAAVCCWIQLNVAQVSNKQQDKDCQTA